MTTIRIYGIGDAKTRALRNNVAEALLLCPLEGAVEEITEVNQITASGVSRTPALVVDGQIVAEGTVPSAPEIARMLRRRSIYPTKLYRLRRILLAVDFSPASEKAYRYAWELACIFQASIDMVHVMSQVFEGAQGAESGFMHHYQETLKEEVEAFARDTPRQWNAAETLHDAGPGEAPPLPSVTTHVAFGAAEEVLEEWSGQYDLLVLGATGKGRLAASLFGSVSTAVSRDAHCPVLIVPEEAEWSGFRDILYASNFDSNEPDKIFQVAAFSQRLAAQLHFVHVGPPGEPGAALDRLLAEIHLKHSEPDQPFLYTKMNGEDLVGQLGQYAAAHGNDLYVFVTHQRAFWENLLHPSATRRMLLHTDKPMLVLHNSNDMNLPPSVA